MLPEEIRARRFGKRELKKQVVQITLSMFRPLTKVEKSLVGEAAKRYGDFLGLKPIVSSAK